MSNHYYKDSLYPFQDKVLRQIGTFMNFDLGKLEEVKFPEGFDKNKITHEHFAILARESLHGYENSLVGKGF